MANQPGLSPPGGATPPAAPATASVDADALASLTSALVDANDRLLGLVSIINDAAPQSLDPKALVSSIIERAAPILGLDHVTIDGSISGRWGIRPVDPLGSWQYDLSFGAGDTARLACSRAARRFDTSDTKLLVAVARLIVNAVETSRLHASAIDQALMATEHETAAQITAAALPVTTSPPLVEGVDIFARSVPARTTGGDLFAWREHQGRLWFALGDVSGKGLPAAVQMSMITSAIEAAFSHYGHAGVDEVMAAVDDWVHDRLSISAMFVTLIIGCWTPETSTLSLANSGHSPVVLRRDGQSLRMHATAPPVGVIAGARPSAQYLQMQANDVLVLATDGFTEQEDRSGVMFGEDAFDSLVSGLDGDANAMGTSIFETINSHAGVREASDDRTLMVLHFSPS